MKKIFLLIFVLSTSSAFSQKVLFDTLKVNSKTKIIGRYPQYDTKKTFEKFNFIIEDSVSIETFKKNIKLGDEVPNSMESPCFKLTIIKNYNEIGSWTINPTQKSAMTHDGHTYKFDLSQIATLNTTNPFSYFYEIKIFKTKLEYDDYLVAQKSNPKFLFDYGPQFDYEGSFEIEFKKSEEFSSPKKISEYLKSYFEKIANENEYSISYELNEKNKNNRDQFTMKIESSKKIFKKFKLKNLKKENWQPTIADAYFFYKT
ncbi:hypothetical protein [Flavobacterium sp. TBRC 19031]|uniref:hypothetical protein n=1 Tax=Flavobacterium mekongense TaxID=3379707 RepID=UPI003999FDF7